jgi:hypothetical protein
MARESTSGTAIPHDSPAAKARPLTLGLAAASVTAGFLTQGPAEAAHVQSRSRTEPMRCDCRSRVPSRSRFLGNAPGFSSVTLRGSSSPTCLACAWHGEVSGTLRFQIPLEGKRRQRRRLVGTRVGLIP